MAIFDFVKEAGEALFHGHAAGQPSTSPQSATSPSSSTTEQLVQKLGEYLQKLNFGIENPQVKVEGDKPWSRGKPHLRKRWKKLFSRSETRRASQKSNQKSMLPPMQMNQSSFGQTR